MVTVKQLAEEIGVSKTAIMKRLKRMGVEPQTAGNKIVIDERTADIIKQEYLKNRKPIANQSQTANHDNDMENGCFAEKSPTENCKPTANQNENRQPEIENQSQTYFAEYVQLLHEQIADLKAEKAMMQQRIDEKDAHIMEMHKNAEKHSQQMEEMRLKLEGVEKQLELMATQPEQTEIIIQPEPELQEEKKEPEPQPEKKKGFLARLFG